MGKWDDYYTFVKKCDDKAMTLCKIITKLIFTYSVNKYCNDQGKHTIFINTNDS